MPDKNAVPPTCAQLQRRVVELENQLTLRSGQCAQAVAALMQVTGIATRIAHHPTSSSQAIVDAIHLQLCAASVIDMLTDEVEGMDDSVVLREAVEAARNMLASNALSTPIMH
ncbi:hypothetical protein P3T23_009473 [Paraburkholderia sp. GAS448]|uniref:hypothetical protein n=1 Tax=Paraburkholderia sp. GAS448 TaxID=3035136 RepID=UPI003D1C46EB